MRVLFTVQPSTGHLHPLVPVASALADAGHQVAVCSAALFRPEVEAFGLEHIDAGLDWIASDHSTWGPFGPMPAPGPEFGKFVINLFANVTTSHMVPDLLEIARDFRPDVIVRESMEYGGCIAAESLGIPHASVAGNAYSAIDSPDVHYFVGNRRLVAGPLAQHRERFGLPPDPDVGMPFRHLHICFMPKTWDGEDAPAPANSRYLRHTSTVQPGAKLPTWAGKLPDRPTILASLGTVFNKTPGVLEAIIEGIASEPVNLIVAIGRDEDRARFGKLPSNVRLEAYVPQPLLLEHWDLFVTHGGFNSVKESLIAGVPMVVVPITADQPYSAQRCAALGVARAIGADERNPETIGAAVRDVLEDQTYRTEARRVQSAMESLPPTEDAVELLESVARDAANAAR
jgi:MGT family glycosyltransferase